MKCFKCGKEGNYKIPSLCKVACSSCFSQIIEKRVKKSLTKKPISVVLKRPSDYVLKYILSKLGAYSPDGFKVPQYTLDDYCISIIRSFDKGKDFLLEGDSPLKDISEDELITYSQINKLDFKGNPRNDEDKKYHSFLLEIEKRRSGAMYSISKFIRKLK